MPGDPLLFIQVYTDEHIMPVLVRLLRERGYVARSAQEAGMIERDDDVHLAYATQNSMAILTYNAKDFYRLARQWAAIGREHADIIISPQYSRRQVQELLQPLIRLLDSTTADEIRNQVIYLQSFGARRLKRISEIGAEYAVDVAPR